MEIKANYQSILKIALPLILANLVGGVGQIIDTAFVNRIGEKELNGTVIGAMVWMFFSFILLGFSSYVQRLIAKKIGEKKNKEVGHIVDNIIILGVFLFLFIIIIFSIIRVKGLSLMIKDTEIILYAFEYLDVLIYGLPITICVSFFSAFFSALGKTQIITYSVVTYIIVNLILDYLLIFGNFGCPALGVYGSGLATVIALFFSGLTYLYFGNKLQVVKTYNLFRFKTLNVPFLIEVTKKATPLVLQNLFHTLAYWVFFIMIEKMGSAELRVSLIIRSLYLFLCLPLFGLGRAVNTILSNMIGRKDYDNVYKAIIKSHQVSLGISGILCLLIFLIPELLLNIYTTDQALIQDAIPILRILLVSIILFSISTINTNIIIATGETKYVFVIGAISVISYLLYAYLSIFWWQADITTVWLSDWLNWSIFTILSTTYFFIWKRKQNKIRQFS
ncbi:MATE family efflux transporter [Pontimicrobium sp. MEBiC06410]